MIYTSAISDTFVNLFETRCPNLRMTKKEREALHKLFTECQFNTWDSCIHIMEGNKPKKP